MHQSQGNCVVARRGVADGASVPISASASDSDGTVARVDFYVNGLAIGGVTTPPYTVTWSGSTTPDMK
jgi:chitinase